MWPIFKHNLIATWPRSTPSLMSHRLLGPTLLRAQLFYHQWTKLYIVNIGQSSQDDVSF